MKTRSITASAKTLVVGIPAHWGTVMPPLQHSAYGHMVLENQFESLVHAGNKGLMEPQAATSWEVSQDHRMARFKIDTKRRFSDGTPLTAMDFKRSWEEGLQLKAKSKNKSLEDALYNIKGFDALEKTGHIDGIKVLGADVLEIEFNKPMRAFLGEFAGARCAVYKMVDGHPIGTGPYVIQEKETELILTPNAYYSGSEPRFQQIRIVVTPLDKVADRLRSGEIDATLFSEKSYISECVDGKPGRIACAYSQEADHVAVEVNGLPGRIFADRRNRLALQTLLNDRLKKDPLPTALKAGRFIHDPQSFLSFQAGRLDDSEARGAVEEGRAAIARLKEASQKRPIYVASGSECQWLIALLEEAGLKIAPQSGRMDFPRVLEMIYKTHEADLILGTFSVYSGDPDGLYHLLGKRGAIFSPMMDRPRVAELFESGRKIMDRESLAPHYQKAARAILSEVPYVHLGYNSRGVAYNSDKARIAESFVMRENNRVTIFEPK